MKIFCFPFAFLLFVFSVSAQDPAGWSYQYTLNYRHMNAAHIIDNNTVFLAGGHETNDKIRSIYNSTDGGYNWNSLFDQPDSSWLKAIWFIDINNGFAAGYEGVVLKTTNGGQSWTRTPVPANAATRNFNSIFFVDAQTGFVAGGNKTNDSVQTILKTTDGGNTWDIQRDVPGYWLKAIYFTDVNNGYATGENGVALKTIDGGDNWNQMSLPGGVATRTYNTVFFVDAITGFLGGGNEANDSIQTILKTTNGGTSWDIIQDSIAPWINSIQFVNTSTGYAAGDDGTVLVSHNGGDAWSDAGIPDSVDNGSSHHRAIYFLNADFGVIVGSQGKILTYHALVPTVPSAQAGFATNTSASSTTFNGRVNANGNTTTVSFEYWTDAGAINTVAAQPNNVTGNMFTSVSATVSGLSTNTYYNFRVKAHNINGTSYSDVKHAYIGTNPIPNWDFEVWDTIQMLAPQQWLATTGVSQITSYDGSHAIRIQGDLIREFGGIFIGNPGRFGFKGGAPFAARPDSLIGFFNYEVAPNDSAVIVLWLKSNGVFNSQQFYYISGSSGGNFQRLSFPISYSNTNIPDSIIIGIASSNPFAGGMGDSTSYVEVDNISFAGTIANVPNYDFESWYPTYIEVLNPWEERFEIPLAGFPYTISKTTDSQHGSFAAKLESNNSGGGEVARIFTADSRPGFPVPEKYTTFNFFMKYFPENNDTFNIVVTMYKAGQSIGFGTLTIDTVVPEYTAFSIPLLYNLDEVPDSANIYATVGTYTNSVPPGHSVLYIDNLGFDGFYTEVKENSQLEKDELWWNLYPNPAHGEIIMQGASNKEEQVILSICNISGTEIKKQKIVLPGGSFKIPIDLENFSNGIYLVTLQKRGSIQFKKLVIGK